MHLFNGLDGHFEASPPGATALWTGPQQAHCRAPGVRSRGTSLNSIALLEASVWAIAPRRLSSGASSACRNVSTTRVGLVVLQVAVCVRDEIQRVPARLLHHGSSWSTSGRSSSETSDTVAYRT